VFTSRSSSVRKVGSAASTVELSVSSSVELTPAPGSVMAVDGVMRRESTGVGRVHGHELGPRRYPRPTVRLVEIRLLEGPNVYRLVPVVKTELTIGRRRTWYGERVPGRHALVRLGATVPARDRPDDVAVLVAWTRRLRAEHDEGVGGLAVHRSSDPGHWIVTWPWTGAERAHTIAEAAFALADRNVSPSRRARLTGSQSRILDRWTERISEARTTPPSWIRDSERRMPVVSISGTNGKSTTTRLLSHILLLAGKRVGTTTSDGILIDERLIEPGDWTGPAGAAQILRRSDVDVGVLETARGGIVLRGVGYESNEASILTNVSADHLDLQGIHTLPELAEVKATISRMTRPDGWAILNADDRFVSAVARRVRANVSFFALDERRSPVLRRHIASRGRAYTVRRGSLVEIDARKVTTIVPVRDIPIAIGGLARHNVANALAAAAGARALGATVRQVHDGLVDFRPSSERSPGRLNLFRLGSRIVIVDFAHNEAGVAAILDVAEGIAGGAAGRAVPVTMIIGTAGDRPDDTLRGIGRIAAKRVDRIAIKETLKYLRGRTRESTVGEMLAGVRSAGVPTAGIPVYESETEALRSELALNVGSARPDGARVVVIMCHEEREEVFRLLGSLGGRQVDVASELTALVPRLQERPRR
jgi:cyanophycin synthetase